MKDRFFVCRNRVDNYVIDYYDGVDETTGTKKGSIYLESYHCEKFDKDDKERFGTDKGIKLVPWWYRDRRRTWYVLFERHLHWQG
jgi:hypothetical protein